MLCPSCIIHAKILCCACLFCIMHYDFVYIVWLFTLVVLYACCMYIYFMLISMISQLSSLVPSPTSGRHFILAAGSELGMRLPIKPLYLPCNCMVPDPFLTDKMAAGSQLGKTLARLQVKVKVIHKKLS